MVECGAKSESGKNMSKRRVENSFSLPTPPPSVAAFSCAHLFAPSRQSECLEQAIFSEAGLVRQGILLPGKWTWYFHCDIVALQMCIRLSCFRFWQRVSNANLALKISPDVLIYLVQYNTITLFKEGSAITCYSFLTYAPQKKNR